MKRTGAVYKSFRRFIAGVWDDYMLVACTLAPIFMGVAFKFGITYLEQFLCDYFELTAILSPYYGIFDLLLAIMTPVMFAFSGVMTMLEELDNGTARYLMVTPLGKKGYIASRIGIISILAVFYDIVMLLVFGISGMNILMQISISVLSAIIGLIISLIVVSFAHNKVEGMALIKLSGVMIAGIPVAYFVTSPIAYLCGIMPSFWLAKLAIEEKYMYLPATLLCSILWLVILYRRFDRKLV